MEMPLTTCPKCLAVRQAQGFPVMPDQTQHLCHPCLVWELDKQYFESEAYQSWLSSIPSNLTIEQYTQWTTENPPPPRLE